MDSTLIITPNKQRLTPETETMQILLIGEYSRLHCTLAEGLRALGHSVTVASDGDGFKDYPRNIDLTRKGDGLIATLKSIRQIAARFRKFKNYDIVQLINPCFTTLNIHINMYLYKQLRKKNKKVFLGAFGEDSYWVRSCMNNKTFKYSEFFVDNQPTNIPNVKGLIGKWVDTAYENANTKMAHNADGIIACLYEYYKAYQTAHADKLTYIPLPINTDEVCFKPIERTAAKVNFFIGINSARSQLKGTDVMEKALMRLHSKYPDEVNIIRVVDLSYEQYGQHMLEADVVLDQLYSYSPAMNALQAMAQGKIAVTGGEPEMYELMNEHANRPIINVFPTEEDVFLKIEHLLLNKHILPQQSKNSRLFIEQNHHYVHVAQQYINFWNK